MSGKINGAITNYYPNRDLPDSVEGLDPIVYFQRIVQWKHGAGDGFVGV